jgi:preprotein translocase subunit SecG
MHLLALSWGHYFFIFTLSILSVFMILVILVQRGRGGGLTGALGGMGGQSAFGTKAGDLFTRITIVVAAIWVILSMVALKVLNPHGVTGFDESLRGKAAAAAKSMDTGLPPGKATSDATGSSATPATSSAEAPAAKMNEAPASGKAETPATALPTAAPSTTTESPQAEPKAP